MSLPHALLTSLIERPCSGLDLATRFDRSIGHFWQATHQQIYRELTRLEEQGWVESTAVEAARGRKRLYQVLPAGREELGRWVRESEDPKPLRDAMMVKLRAEAAIGPLGLEHEIRRHLGLHRETLALYRAIEARDFAGTALPRAQQLQHLVLTTGIESEKLYVDIMERALGLLEQQPD